MGRSRRRPRSRESSSDASFERLLSGWRRTETRRGSSWSVQPVGPGRSEKPYTCPGCQGAIAAGDAHVVTWREDGVLGAAADLAARRHWHTHCWNIF
ncbi:hypothetical protein [Microbacterium excoecariae]|uniref:hypothetical protein n=1 Tax=Microbacterium excoecariae TaxID=2715210 RepID=UPI0014080C64|nr:hypothetical protein [Microbacterium excoecariae]NHI16904.1 hypothetical protein [Microbacterium excoecariae]